MRAAWREFERDFTDKTLPENGHGIQHLDDLNGYFDTVVAAVTAALSAGACG